VGSLAADRAPRLRRRGAPLRPTLMRLTSNLHHPNDQNIVGEVELDLAVALKVEFFSHYGICCDRLGIMHDCAGTDAGPSPVRRTCPRRIDKG